MYIVHSGLQDEGLQVDLTILNYRRVLQPAQSVTFPARGRVRGGSSVNVPIRRTTHCFHVMPATDTKEKVFGHQKSPCLSLGLIPVPFDLEASALPTDRATALHQLLRECYANGM